MFVGKTIDKLILINNNNDSNIIQNIEISKYTSRIMLEIGRANRGWSQAAEGASPRQALLTFESGVMKRRESLNLMTMYGKHWVVPNSRW